MTRIDRAPERRISPTITDEEVALLPLAAGRADLLEEIMSTPVLDRAEPTTRRTPPGWLVVAAAAAAVAAIALGTTLGGESGPRPAPQADPPPAQEVVEPGEFMAAPVAPVVPPVPGGRYVGVEVVGWDLEALYEGYGELTIGWKSGQQWLEVVRYPADSYTSYFADRDANREGSATRLFGRDATTWAYSPDDHATMTTPGDGFFFEVRAAGMPLPAYEELIASLVQTDEAGFYAGLPEGTVTPANREQAVNDLLRGVTVPDGFGPADVRLSGFNDPYQSSAAVAGSVGCAWLDVYEGGTAAQQDRALAALEGSSEWPLLVAIAGDGGYTDVFLDLADRLRDGEPAAGLRGAIC